MKQVRLLPVDEDLLTKKDIALAVNKIYQALAYISPILNLNLGQVEPTTDYKRDGILAYADGVNFNPGSGKGLYRYDSSTSSWVFVG
ncbi:MAG: hypothetical protein AB1567_08575 [bacterium]